MSGTSQQTINNKKAQSAFLCKLRFFSCGGPTRTDDLQVMSLASYQLLHSAMLTIHQGLFPDFVCKGKGFINTIQILEMFFLFFPQKNMAVPLNKTFFPYFLFL